MSTKLATRQSVPAPSSPTAAWPLLDSVEDLQDVARAALHEAIIATAEAATLWSLSQPSIAMPIGSFLQPLAVQHVHYALDTPKQESFYAGYLVESNLTGPKIAAPTAVEISFPTLPRTEGSAAREERRARLRQLARWSTTEMELDWEHAEDVDRRGWGASR